MPSHVANREDARRYMVDPGLMDSLGDLATGSLIDLVGERLIIIDPPRRDGAHWTFTAAPALAIGREAGTA